jgi:hypothetical protein
LARSQTQRGVLFTNMSSRIGTRGITSFVGCYTLAPGPVYKAWRGTLPVPLPPPRETTIRNEYPAPSLAADVVVALARLEGYPLLDSATAARIAVGATNAVRGVAAHATMSFFDTDPGGYLAELERLSEAD